MRCSYLRRPRAGPGGERPARYGSGAGPPTSQLLRGIRGNNQKIECLDCRGYWLRHRPQKRTGSRCATRWRLGIDSAAALRNCAIGLAHKDLMNRPKLLTGPTGLASCKILASLRRVLRAPGKVLGSSKTKLGWDRYKRTRKPLATLLTRLGSLAPRRVAIQPQNEDEEDPVDDHRRRLPESVRALGDERQECRDRHGHGMFP